MSRTVSPSGLALIKKFEGFIAAPTPMGDGRFVIGHGHVRDGAPGEAISADEAEALLVQDLSPIVDFINQNVSTKLTQSQFDVLVSFAFSIGLEAFGPSAVLRRVQSGRMIAAACAMEAWRKSDAGGELEVLGALVRRRAAEKAIFLKTSANPPPAPSVFLRPQIDHAMSILGAPVAYAITPALQIPQAAPAAVKLAKANSKVDPGVRITEILKSEPATAALLLTQPVIEDDEDDADLIVTAHAKPVARGIGKTRRFVFPKLPKLPKIAMRQPVETFGLATLLAFGFGLCALGVTTLISGQGDLVDLLGASALGGPGLIAIAMASLGLLRHPVRVAV